MYLLHLCFSFVKDVLISLKCRITEKRDRECVQLQGHSLKSCNDPDWPGHTWRLELLESPKWVQENTHLGLLLLLFQVHYQGTGLEVGQSGLEPLLTGDAGIVGHGFWSTASKYWLYFFLILHIALWKILQFPTIKLYLAPHISVHAKF